MVSKREHSLWLGTQRQRFRDCLRYAFEQAAERAHASQPPSHATREEAAVYEIIGSLAHLAGISHEEFWEMLLGREDPRVADRDERQQELFRP